jgi:transcriptional regulator with XRE-family HTH domain
MPAERKQFLPTMRAQFLGERMRQLREGRGLTLKYIAAYIGVEFSTLARYERAEWPFRRDHVTALLDVYGIFEEAERDELVNLARNAWRMGQWEIDGVKDSSTAGLNDRPVIDHWWIQSRAEELCVYATNLMPELLRSRDYAEAIIRRTEGDRTTVQRIDNQLRRHEQRQQVLHKKPPIRYTTIIDESVLTKQVGGRLVLQAQLEQLTRIVELPHVTVLVLPSHLGLHPGMDGPFTVCRIQRPYPPVALLGQLAGRAVVEASAADRYDTAFNDLKALALDPVQSIELIAKTAEQLA